MTIETRQEDFDITTWLDTVKRMIDTKSKDLYSVFVAIGWGVWSWKTSVITKKLKEWFEDRLSIIKMDDYFKNEDEVDRNHRGEINRDEPQSVDLNKLIADIKALKWWQKIEKPIYDFVSNKRVNVEEIYPNRIMLLEWIFMLDNIFKEHSDIKVFVDADPSTRLLRILFRDIYRKQMRPADIMTKYFLQSKPMHEKYIEPTKKNADIIIKNDLNTESELRKEKLKMIFI